MTTTTGEPKKASVPDKFTEVVLTFEDSSVSTECTPELCPILCAMCGKRCQELGKPLCREANPNFLRRIQRLC
jgi:phage FluMu gp28-like protein